MTAADPATIIGQVYDAAFTPEVWPGLLCDIADFCGVENAALVITDPASSYSSVLTPRANPDVVAAYGELWWEHDPTAVATAQAPVGQITSLDDTGREIFFGSAFYNDFWRRSELGAERVAANLFTDGDGFASLVLQSGVRHDEIDRDTAQRYSFLIPHLVRAVDIGRRTRRMELERASWGGNFGPHHAGLFIVDNAGRILFADTAGETLLRAGGPVGGKSGRIQLSDAWANDRLMSAIEACARDLPPSSRDSRIHLQQPQAGEAMSVEVQPCRIPAPAGPFGQPPAAILRVTDPDRGREARLADFRARFNLTAAEARLAFEMLRGDGRAAAAARCGITTNTARSHLTHIFQKVGVRRQSELVRQLLGHE